MLRRPAVVRCALAALLAAALLAACGGGVWIGSGGDDPPQVSLATVASASAGQSLRLAAAASDDGFVDRVAFYRLDDDGQEVLLGDDDSAPYEWITTMPSSNRGTVRFFARAFDNTGLWTDSEIISVAVAS
jgi:ABC-type glycerol-3-phosphate transport system substrate-binding protein